MADRSAVVRVMGIDPGIAITGWGVLDIGVNRRDVISYGAIRTHAGIPMNERLVTLYNDLEQLIDEFKPSEFAIENLFFFKNAKTIISVGQARGVSILAAAKGNLEIYEYTPLQIKQAVTGYGRASKAQVQLMIKEVLGLEEIPKPDDVADAVAAAYTHSVFKSSVR